MLPRVVLALASMLMSATAGLSFELRLPADCKLGEQCFFQQFPDMDGGPGAVDPFCGIATYNEHDGVDLRVLSMKDMRAGIPVVAAADGKVLRLRDEVQDRLIATDAERKAIMPQACGNGVIISHADGFETQYCHLRLGSVLVSPGQIVKAGDKIGEIGASGLVEFPHVHLTVRHNGVKVDPLTGRKVGSACISDKSKADPIFAPSVMEQIVVNEPIFLGVGVSGSVPEYSKAVEVGPPEEASAGDKVAVVWAWIANMRKGDQLRSVLKDPDGATIVDNTMPPLDRSKAVLFNYAGKKQAPRAGIYRLEVTIVREKVALKSLFRRIEIK